MLPSLYIPSYKLFGLIPIQPFGVLVAIALVLGYMLGRRRARLTGLDPQICADGQVWIVVTGFAMAHWVSVLFYFPERVFDNERGPLFGLLSLFAFWSGLSSFGGLFGAALAAIVYFKKKGVEIIKYVDAIIFGFVPAWVIGRMGCTVVFDHPGKPTDFVLGMAYHKAIRIGAVDHPQGVVLHNLGLYEMLISIPLAIILYALKNVRPFDGFHPAVMLLLYSPVRFYLDTLRIQDKTYWGLTPGQFFSLFMVALAAVLIVRGVHKKRQILEAPAPQKSSRSRKKRRRGGRS